LPKIVATLQLNRLKKKGREERKKKERKRRHRNFLHFGNFLPINKYIKK